MAIDAKASREAAEVAFSEGRARRGLAVAVRSLARLMDDRIPRQVATAAAMVGTALREGGKVMFCGNGGSAADAQHLATELVGRLDGDRDREPLPGLALTTDTSALTALANDYGYDQVFARQVVALGRRGDVLVCISTSGSSVNVLRAAAAAGEHGIRVIGLVGPTPSPLDRLADLAIHAPGATSGQIQQAHIVLGHLLCEMAEEIVAAA